MSRNLIEQNENDLLEIRTADEPASKNAAARFSGTDDAEDLLEIPESIDYAPKNFEISNHAIQTAENNFSAEIETDETQRAETKTEEFSAAENKSETWIDKTEIEEIRPENNGDRVFQTPVNPESIGETARKSGLAYGAAITLFGSVIFLLALGWLADWFLGTSPWGIVLGIVLGAVVGFYQFFRITSQIFKK